MTNSLDYFNVSIAACAKCMQDCIICLNEMAGKAFGNDCPKCCSECIDICNVTMKAMLNNSPRVEEYIQLCKTVCEWCADQCRQHSNQHCQNCAASCQNCIEVLEVALEAR